MGITLKDNGKRPPSPGDFLASFGPTMERPGKGKIPASDFGAGEGSCRSCKEVSGLRLGGKEREVGGEGRSVAMPQPRGLYWTLRARIAGR